jgi:putative NADH-flavin reductase
MRVLILGATGRVGKLIVEQALPRGHHITALARDPAKLGSVPNGVTVVHGDVRDPAAIDRAVAGQDAVIYAIGAGNVRKTTLFSVSTDILVKAMTRHGVRRLVAITGVGAGDTKGHGGFLYDRVLYPLFTRGIYEDKDRQEELIRASALDWVIVRPAPFRGKRSADDLDVAVNLQGVTLRRITQSEVAAFVVDQLETNRYLKQSPFIGHR